MKITVAGVRMPSHSGHISMYHLGERKKQVCLDVNEQDLKTKEEMKSKTHMNYNTPNTCTT